MSRFLLVAILLVVAGTPLAAQEKNNHFAFGGDSFVAGATAILDSDGVDDLFMFGETVRGKRAITGSAHLAGRKVFMDGAVGGDAYLAGMDVSMDGAVAGDATVSGYNVQIGEVAGDLRVSAANLVISGPVSGYALVAGDDVRFQSIIKGDVSLTAREVDFAEGARFEGKLTIYERKPGEIDVPPRVVPEDRIERRDVSEWSHAAREATRWGWRGALGRFLIGVVIVAAIAALIAALVPERLAELRRSILDRPFRNLLYGFLAQSALVGSIIILMMTVVGLLLAPAAVFVALLSAYAGYVVAAYAVGVGLSQIFGRPEPDSLATRALAAGVGAFVVGIIALIPFLGWLFVLAVALTGVGAITIWLFRPKFFAAV